MTPIKTESIKCEFSEDDIWRSYFIKGEDAKCKFCSVENDNVKIKPLDRKFTDFPCETAEHPAKYLRPPPKTPAERKRAQREREKQLREELGLIRLKGPPKSAAERKRAQREREKQMRKQIDLLFPKRLEKIPGETRKERIEREKQLKLELGLITPKGRPKTAAERKRAQREREKLMKLEISLYSLQKAKKIKCLHNEKDRLLHKNSAIHMRQFEVKRHQMKIDIGLLKPSFMPKFQAPQKHQECRKELKPLSTNGPNVPTEIKPVLKSAEWLDHIPKFKFPTGENVKPVFDLEFVDCGKVISTDNPSLPHYMEE